jgi:uncharacterized integral membrane protein
MLKVIKTIFFTLLFILGITFAMNNSEGIVLKYYFGLQTPEVPIFLLVLFSVLFGILLAGAGYIFDQWSLKRALREREREIVSLQKELNMHRDRATENKE